VLQPQMKASGIAMPMRMGFWFIRLSPECDPCRDQDLGMTQRKTRRYSYIGR
jgi:hypothetical protein